AGPRVLRPAPREPALRGPPRRRRGREPDRPGRRGGAGGPRCHGHPGPRQPGGQAPGKPHRARRPARALSGIGELTSSHLERRQGKGRTKATAPGTFFVCRSWFGGGRIRSPRVRGREATRNADRPTPSFGSSFPAFVVALHQLPSTAHGARRGPYLRRA